MNGNNPIAWQKFLGSLDDKLQLALLEQMRKITGYHIEADTLYIDPASPEQAEHLKKEAVLQQLQLLAQDLLKIEQVKIR